MEVRTWPVPRARRTRDPGRPGARPSTPRTSCWPPPVGTRVMVPLRVPTRPRRRQAPPRGGRAGTPIEPCGAELRKLESGSAGRPTGESRPALPQRLAADHPRHHPRPRTTTSRPPAATSITRRTHLINEPQERSLPQSLGYLPTPSAAAPASRTSPARPPSAQCQLPTPCGHAWRRPHDQHPPRPPGSTHLPGPPNRPAIPVAPRPPRPSTGRPTTPARLLPRSERSARRGPRAATRSPRPLSVLTKPAPARNSPLLLLSYSFLLRITGPAFPTCPTPHPSPLTPARSSTPISPSPSNPNPPAPQPLPNHPVTQAPRTLTLTPTSV